MYMECAEIESKNASNIHIIYIYIYILHICFCCSLLLGADGLQAMGLTLNGPPILLRYSANILLKLCSDLLKPNHKGQAVTMRGCSTVLWFLPYQLDFKYGNWDFFSAGHRHGCRTTLCSFTTILMEGASLLYNRDIIFY